MRNFGSTSKVVVLLPQKMVQAQGCNKDSKSELRTAHTNRKALPQGQEGGWLCAEGAQARCSPPKCLLGMLDATISSWHRGV